MNRLRSSLFDLRSPLFALRSSIFDLRSPLVDLGTVYELLGKNDSALYWINKAIAINPASHYGSEWIHVQILEAKIKGATAINTDFLLKTNFGDDVVPVTKLSNAQLMELKDALNYQLNERISFVKPEEPIVALLLFELGNATAIAEDVTSALRIYDLAKKYGYKSDLFDKRYKHFVDLQSGLHNEYTDRSVKNEEVIVKASTNPAKKNNNLIFIMTAVLLVCIAAIVMLLRSRKKNLG